MGAHVSKGFQEKEKKFTLLFTGIVFDIFYLYNISEESTISEILNSALSFHFLKMTIVTIP